MRARRPWLLALLALFWLGASAPAAAQDLLVVPLGGNASEAQRTPVLDAIAARFAQDGFAVLGPAELVHRVPPSRLALASTDDASQLASDLGAPRVACVSVWVSEGGVSELSLTLHALSGSHSVRHSSASGAVTEGHDVTQVIEAMVAQALASERAAAMFDPGAGTQRPTTPPRTPAGGTTATSPQAPAGGVSLQIEEPPTTPTRGNGPEPLFGILGPGLLAAIGATGIGLGIWASLDSTCERYSADRSVCLRGESQNLAVGIPMMIGGLAALTGAVVWWITGATSPEDHSRIDLSIGPGSVDVRGTF